VFVFLSLWVVDGGAIGVDVDVDFGRGMWCLVDILRG